MRYHLLFILVWVSIPCFAQVLNDDKSTTSGKQPDKYAVVVGISDYQDEGIPDLRFADKDARAFAGFLQSPAGGALDEDHLKVLINEKATAAQFAIALDWLWEVAQENDKVIIYFSGHGDVEKKSLTQPGYLLCWDAPSQVYMAGGAFNVRDLNDVVSTISIQNKAKVMLVTDACRAGKLSGSDIGGAQATASNLAKQYANEIKILSCQPDEYSIEGEQWGGGRGAFSYHLLDGLYGMADGNDDLSVNLLEIGRYLEDHVTREVAPQSQIPMTVGGRGEKLTTIYPEILDQLKAGKRGQMALFNATESRGIEEDALAALSASETEADSNIVEMYFAFKQSLKDKNFLCDIGESTCADDYYEKLIAEPKLEPLHSSMRRNYAAALQDDAQQVMNTMLKSGLTQLILKKADAKDVYGKYPGYLNRAAELLGKDHYMYPILQSRKYFFEGMVLKESSEKRMAFYQALNGQAEMAHAMVYLVRNFEGEQVDSAEYYTQKAAALIPSWVEPYIALSEFYFNKLRQFDKATEILDQAGKVDSNSVLVWYHKARVYQMQGQNDLAEKWYLKTIEKTGDEVCFPCAHFNLGSIYGQSGLMDETIEQLEKAVQLDFTFYRAINALGGMYVHKRRFIEADSLINKAIQFGSNELLPYAYQFLGQLYYFTGRYTEAEQQFNKALEFGPMYYDPTFTAKKYLGMIYYKTGRNASADSLYNEIMGPKPHTVNACLGIIWAYFEGGQFDKAEEFCQKGLQLDSVNLVLKSNLGWAYLRTNQLEKAEQQFLECIILDSIAKDVHANLGLVYAKMGRYDEAKQMFLQSLELNPENEKQISVYYAVLYSLQNQINKAFEYLGKALELEYVEPFYFKLKDETDLDPLKAQTEHWNALMKKYFPDEF